MSHYAIRLEVGALAIAVVAVAAGCGNSRSILYKGIEPGGGGSGQRIVISDVRAI